MLSRKGAGAQQADGVGWYFSPGVSHCARAMYFTTVAHLLTALLISFVPLWPVS